MRPHILFWSLQTFQTEESDTWIFCQNMNSCRIPRLKDSDVAFQKVQTLPSFLELLNYGLMKILKALIIQEIKLPSIVCILFIDVVCISCVRALVNQFFWRVIACANEPQQHKTNKMACAPSEDSDQHGHPHGHQSLRSQHEESFGP